MSSDAEQDFLQFLYLVPVGLIAARPDGTVVTLNPLATQILIGLSGNPDLSNAYRSFERAFPDLAEQVAAHDGVGPVVDNARFELPHAVGDARNFALTVTSISDERIGFVINDISALVAQEREVRRREAEMRTLVDSVHTHMIVSLEPDGRVHRHNTTISRLTGFGREVVGKPIDELFDDDLDVERLCELTDTSGWTEIEGAMVGPDGTSWWGSSVYTRVVDECERTVGYVMVSRQETARHLRELQLTEWATTDALTGVASRRAFEEHLAERIESAERSDRPVAFLLLDIDRFKAVNDTHGHSVGDEVLVELADRLTGALRTEDLVVRMGGEEFGVLLADADDERASRVAERLRATIAETPFRTSAGKLEITISGGVCHWRHGSSTFSSVYVAADEALYAAKEAGRNRIVVA